MSLSRVEVAHLFARSAHPAHRTVGPIEARSAVFGGVRAATPLVFWWLDGGVVLSEPEKSLATLRVKIGKPFVNGLTRDRVDLPFLRTIVELASQLGLEVVAEGIETGSSSWRYGASGVGSRGSTPGPAELRRAVVADGAVAESGGSGPSEGGQESTGPVHA